VALDQACVDLIFQQEEGDGALLCYMIDSQNGQHLLEYGERIGLGSRNYELISID
jgi:hypothetical protein